MERIYTKSLRMSLGDILNKTHYGQESFIISRRDDDIAVLLSIEEWHRIEQTFRELDKLREKKG